MPLASFSLCMYCCFIAARGLGNEAVVMVALDRRWQREPKTADSFLRHLEANGLLLIALDTKAPPSYHSPTHQRAQDESKEKKQPQHNNEVHPTWSIAVSEKIQSQHCVKALL